MGAPSNRSIDVVVGTDRRGVRTILDSRILGRPGGEFGPKVFAILLGIVLGSSGQFTTTEGQLRASDGEPTE